MGGGPNSYACFVRPRGPRGPDPDAVSVGVTDATRSGGFAGVQTHPKCKKSLLAPGMCPLRLLLHSPCSRVA